MSPRITSVRYLRDYTLELLFTSGEHAALDLRDKVVGRGGVFARLEDPAFFGQVQVDSEAGTLFWPNGVDFCPDVLYSEATGAALPVPELV